MARKVCSFVILLTLVVSLPVSADLVHRYDFSTDATDLVGSADGTLENGAYISGGQVVVDGVDDFVNLDPNNPGTGIFINQYTTGLTLELWLTQTTDQDFSMTASFGDTWPSGLGKDYLGISTTRGNNSSVGVIANTPDDDQIWLDEILVTGPEYFDGIEHHYVMVIDDPAADGSGSALYYIDGIPQGAVSLGGTLIANTSNQYAYLGKGVYSVDDTVAGTINDFRIHDSALAQTDVMLNAQLGPDQVQSSALESMTPGLGQQGVIFDPNVALSWVVDAGISVDHYEVFVSTDPNVIDPNQAMTTALVGSPTVANLNVSGLAGSTEYYWRVDVIESGTLNRILGPGYLFTTAEPGPVIITDPENTDVLFAGDTGEMTVEYHSADGASATVQWFKVGGPDVEITAGGDVTITNNTVGYVTTSMLSIANLDVNDEAQYYAVATDGKGSAQSANASMFIRVGLTHRWSFNDDPNDSVSGADGIMIDPQGYLSFEDDGNGGRQLRFSQSIEASNRGNIGYVDLPNGIVSALGTQATFEVWFTWGGPSNQSWQRLFDFGVSSGGEDVSAGGSGDVPYVMLTPRSGPGTLRCGINGTGIEERTLNWNQAAPVDQEVFVAITWNDDTGIAKMYVNGQLTQQIELLQTLANITDVNNWFGRAQWPDAGYKGTLNEFRIFDEALSASWVEAHYNAGPEVVPENACTNPPTADIAPVGNLDCRVDMLDLAQLALDWLSCGLVVCD